MKTSKWLVLAAMMLTAGCLSSKITSTWKAKDYVPGTYNKIMVLALIREADRTLQENMESHLVGDLKALGYNAISSYDEYGPKAFNKMDEETAVKSLKKSNVDAVITIVLLDKEKERKYVAGHIYYSPYGYYYNRFWNYRTTLYNRIYEPGYYVTNTKYFWESNLYDMATQQLVYSVQTQSFDPASSDFLGHEYGKLIVQEMVKEKVLEDRHAASAKQLRS